MPGTFFLEQVQDTMMKILWLLPRIDLNGVESRNIVSWVEEVIVECVYARNDSVVVKLPAPAYIQYDLARSSC